MEHQSPTIDEAFLSLDIQTATAVIEQLSLACNWRQCEGQDKVDFWQLGKSWYLSIVGKSHHC